MSFTFKELAFAAVDFQHSITTTTTTVIVPVLAILSIPKNKRQR